MVENMIDIALQEAIEKYEDNKTLCDAFKRSKAVWDNISITCLEFFGMTYDEFLEYLESHSNILFLPDDKMKDYKKQMRRLIIQTEDVSVYEEKRCSNAPNINKQVNGIIAIGGIITVANNHNNQTRWKEWKWFQAEDGTVFNNKDSVINMLISLVANLHIKE